LEALQTSGTNVYITGGGTKWEGKPDGSVLLSSRSLRGVVSIEEDDFYIRVMAGTPVDEIQTALGKLGLWTPLPNPRLGGTVGGAVAANINSPYRVRYGSIRDNLLALQVVLPDGRLLRFGRPLMKDVAGYSMKNLFIGSYGTLGLITEITLKLIPTPIIKRNLLIIGSDLDRLIKWGLAIYRISWISSGLVISPVPPDIADKGQYILIFSVEGHPSDVSSEIQSAQSTLESLGVNDYIESNETSASEQWGKTMSRGNFVIRSCVLPSDLQSFICHLDESLLNNPFVIDIINGTMTMAFQNSKMEDAELILSIIRQSVNIFGGYTIAVVTPRCWLKKLDLWGFKPESIDIMQALKNRWDPTGIVNPGEFILQS
jgi:D-lactate dehydrogenase (cytochrome)